MKELIYLEIPFGSTLSERVNNFLEVLLYAFGEFLTIMAIALAL